MNKINVGSHAQGDVKCTYSIIIIHYLHEESVGADIMAELFTSGSICNQFSVMTFRTEMILSTTCVGAACLSFADFQSRLQN